MADPTSSSLFDTPRIWNAAPTEAFAAWLVSDAFAVNRRGERQQLRDSSVRVYRAMFSKFAREVLVPEDGRPPKQLPAVSADDIRRFLDTNALTKGIRHRYIKLLERTFDHLASIGMMEANPARGLAIRQPTRSGAGNEKTMWLSQAQQDAVLAALPSGEGWKAQRSRAMIAAVLGGGLKVSEVIRLPINSVGARQEDGSLLLDVYPAGAGRMHRTRVSAQVAGILAQWRATREGLPLPGKLLFPAGPTGGGLHPATVYRQVKAVLAEAGIPEDLVKRRGARTLRNSFAIRQLETGAAPALVGEYLGHRADRSTRYYTDLLPKNRKG
ncbi:MAG TPA: tyrosine-type recombinase/integrase [Noviherbaspirillum sp.]|jgi:site-specific recombinase XerD|uniref:tyrosine-type recombinase/integrase n=1 Tax=Noviherbaspirillum sp. TaxID=1926288 RepID=UPI002F940A98